MVPVVLFLLGLPNKAPSAKVGDYSGLEEPLIEARLVYEIKQFEDLDEPYLPAMVAAGMVPPLGLDPFSHLTATGSFTYERKEKVELPIPVEYRQLFDSQNNPTARDYYKRKTVLVKGKFKQTANPKVAIVARFLRQCCSADAVQISMPIVSRKSLAAIPDDSWVHVIGKVDYYRRGDQFVLRIMVPGPGPQSVEVTRQDESAFIDN